MIFFHFIFLFVFGCIMNALETMVPSKRIDIGGSAICYYDEPHVYALESILETPNRDNEVACSLTEMISVSKFIDAVLPGKLDPQEIITQRRPEWTKKNHTVYANMSDEAILNMWETNNAEAIELGKSTHAMIESFLIPEIKYKRAVYVKPVEHLKVELQAYKKFRREHPHLKPVMVESVVYDTVAMLAGTFDALFVNVNTKKYVLVDWKRCKRVGTNSEFDTGDDTVEVGAIPNKKENHPCLTGLDTGNYVKYALQLGLYKHMILSTIANTERDPRPDKGVPFEIEECMLINVHPIFAGHYQKIRLIQGFYDTYVLPLITSVRLERTSKKRILENANEEVECDDIDVAHRQKKRKKENC